MDERVAGRGMTQAVFLLLCVAAASAQSVSLEGRWKWRSGDDPRFAEPGWDDSTWAERGLPRREPAPRGITWFRWHGIAPAAPANPLALVVGSYATCGEAFLNGVRLGSIPCRPGDTPPFFAAQVYPVPEGLVKPGQPFLIALRADQRVRIGGSIAFLRDEGPYLLTDRLAAETAVAAGLGRLQRQSLPLVIQMWTAFSIGCLVLVLWVLIRSRRELLWFGLQQIFIYGYHASQVWLVYEGGERETVFAWWFLRAANLFLLAAVHQVVFGRDLAGKWWVAAASVMAIWPGTPVWLSGLFGLLLLWAVKRLRAPQRLDRLFALALLTFALIGLNNVANQVFAGRWPVPAAFWVGPFMNVTLGTATSVFSSVMLVLLILRLGVDQREKQRLSGEMAAAAGIQALLLPAGSASGVEGIYLPAAEVGGDFYQILDREDGSRLVVVGDVSGKGLKAAMLVSVVIGLLRNEKSSSPGAVLAALNRGLHGQTGGGFVTCCCVRVGEGITVANAGHLAPYVDGREVELASGLPLGLLPDADYEETVASGSQITLVTDGVVEAARASGELFGFDRTREISRRPASEIAEAARAWGQNDDITVVTVGRSA